MIGSSKYTGRVGALAVALGIGTAVASSWVAVADPSADSSSTSDSSTSADDSSTSADDTPSADDSVGDKLSMIDTANNLVVRTIKVGDVPVGLAISPDGTRLYVTNFGSDTVSVVAV